MIIITWTFTTRVYLVQSQCQQLKATGHASLSLTPQNMGTLWV